MSSFHKIALSLLISIAIFVFFVLFAFTGVFSAIEAKFYAPSKMSGIRGQLDESAKASELYINNLLNKFYTGEDAYLKDKSVKSYLDSTPSDENIMERATATGKLLAEMTGLSGIRIVESNGRNVHFSTYTEDILRQTETMRMYRDYADLSVAGGGVELPFERVNFYGNASNENNWRITFDGDNNRIIFAFPFFDNYEVHRGTILFYVHGFDFNRLLTAQNIVPLQETCTLVSSEDGEYFGFVFGLPSIGSEMLRSEIVRSWKSGSLGPDKILSISLQAENADGAGKGQQEGEVQESYWIVLTSAHVPYLYMAGVYRDTEFSMMPSVKILLLVCVFITLFLIVFMLFSLKHDDMVVIRDRIKRFQISLINEYFYEKEKVDWAEISRQIAGRKSEVSSQIKKSLGRMAKKHAAETDALIDDSWEAIVSAIGSGNGSVSVSASEIKKLLEDILSSGKIKIPQTASPKQQVVVKGDSVPQAQTDDVSEDVETLDEAEPLEAVPDTEDVVEAESVDDVEEAEALEEVELLEDVPEELAEEVVEAESVDDVEEVEALEEVEVLEDVPEELAEEVVEAESVDDVEEAEALEDVPEELAEEVAEVESVDDVEEAEALEEVEPLEDVPEELAEVESVDDVEEAEALEEVEPLEDAPKEVAEVENEIETVEKVAYVKDAEKMESFGLLDGVPEELSEDVAEIENTAAESSDKAVSPEYFNDKMADAQTAVGGTPSAGNIITDIFRDVPEELDEDGFEINSASKEEVADADADLSALSKEEDLALADENISEASEYDENGERYAFGSTETTHEEVSQGEDDGKLFAIQPAPLDFSQLDDYVYDLQTADADNDKFNFSKFGYWDSMKVDGELQEYSEDVIVQDEDGVFRIANNLIYSDIEQNPSFKKLVDSVIG